jgi:hypothetical protein
MGGMIETITAQYSLSNFFLYFTIVPIGAGLIMIPLSPPMKVNAWCKVVLRYYISGEVKRFKYEKKCICFVLAMQAVHKN